METGKGSASHAPTPSSSESGERWKTDGRYLLAFELAVAALGRIAANLTSINDHLGRIAYSIETETGAHFDTEKTTPSGVRPDGGDT